ncbi:SPRY domain-containing SOCS box protein 3 isoform X2 [Lasioglossum baleicum]|uniref:SPRY domain-containing SOCS box protein 3 isoform X2 n=1 Tax=Lasioglossum baleicum TaxID=434251 RepID=UPI003FCD57AE
MNTELPQWLEAQTVDHPRFCDCGSGNCRCGEDNEFEWEWDKDHVAPPVVLSEGNLTVLFHNEYSTGTSAVRGTKLLEKGRHHYWEVKILTPPYGTDLMVGVGTSKVHMNSKRELFCSFLGIDQESFGFSYQGYIQYDGEKKKYGCSFGQGSLVGVYLNMWKGTLEFFLNRKSLGIAFFGLRNTMLYPIVCSTAVESKMRLSHCSSVPASLQMECLSLLKPSQMKLLFETVPGLRYLSQSIFTRILKPKLNNDDDDGDDDLKFLREYMIFDDFDFALVGIGGKKKRKL